jgi:hypothetical protein
MKIKIELEITKGKFCDGCQFLSVGIPHWGELYCSCRLFNENLETIYKNISKHKKCLEVIKGQN